MRKGNSGLRTYFLGGILDLLPNIGFDRAGIDWDRSVGTIRRGRSSRYMPHQGARECARRRRQMGQA